MRVPIVTTYDGRGARLAQKSLGSLVSRSLAAKLSIAAVGGALMKLGKDSVVAAMADEKAQAALNRTLENAGFAKLTGEVSRYIDQLQRATGVADDQLRPAFSSLFRVTEDVALSQSLLNVAMDTAALTGTDLATAATAISKAMNGQRRQLLSLNTGVDAAIIKNGTLTEALSAVAIQAAGQSAAAIDTYTGKIAILNIATDEAKETVGQALVDAFVQLAGGGSVTSATIAIDNFARVVSTGISKASKFVDDFIIGWQALKDINNWDFNLTGTKAILAGKMTDREKLRREQVRDTDRFFKAYKNQLTLQKQLSSWESKNTAAQAKAAAAKAKADKASLKAAEKSLRLKRLAAKFDLDLIGIAAAKKRTGNATDLARLSALDVLAQDSAGLPISDTALAAAEKGMTINTTVNVTGSVITEQELASSISAQILAQRIRTGTLTGSPGEFRQFEMMTR